MKLFDFSHPFFRPVWRRIVVVAICLGWAVFEFATGAPFWGVIFGSVGIYAAWRFADLEKNPKDGASDHD